MTAIGKAKQAATKTKVMVAEIRRIWPIHRLVCDECQKGAAFDAMLEDGKNVSSKIVCRTDVVPYVRRLLKQCLRKAPLWKLEAIK